MDVTWLVDEYLGNGKVRHAAFSSKRRAVEVAERSCDHSSKVILVEWTYCRPLSAQQLFPVRTDPVAAESVADACSTSVPAIYSLAKGDNPRRAKYDKNADVIGYNLRLPANIHRLLKRHCMETNESMNNVVLVALYRDMKNWEDLAPCPHCGAILPVGAQFCPDCGKEI